MFGPGKFASFLVPRGFCEPALHAVDLSKRRRPRWARCGRRGYSVVERVDVEDAAAGDDGVIEREVGEGVEDGLGLFI